MIMEQSKKNKELVEKLNHVIDKSNAQKKILKKILNQLNKNIKDLEVQENEKIVNKKR